MKEIVLNLKDIHRLRFEARLERLKAGFPPTFKRTRPRDKEKSRSLINFLLKITPPAEDILSGRAFSRRYREEWKRKKLTPQGKLPYP